MNCDDLSIVTIGKYADADLTRTYNSITPILTLGAKWILVISNGPADELDVECYKIIGKDNGLYNALNLGKDSVKTKYFMFLHSGDTIFNHDGFLRALELLKSNPVSCVLGGAKIGARKHNSFSWRPWFLMFYVQPPHLPIIYRTSSVKELRFDESIKIVADYYFLKYYFKINDGFIQSRETYIDMNVGGLTTSGLRSFLTVTNNFYQKDGILAYFLLPFRLVIKIIIK